MIRQYYQLTKPGIIKGNAITAIAGFLFAANGNVNIILLFQMLVGISLVVASGCVFNNYIDRKIDKKMIRTHNRALATGEIPVINALVYGSILGILGVGILLFYANFITASIAILGFFFYVVMYSFWKRKSVYGTLVGSISGAVPPVVGYVAVTNRLDVGAILLFVTLTLWQMPHFYAIAIYRMKDYGEAGIPVLPIVSGVKAAQIHILLYICAFIVVCALFTFLGFAGYAYLVVVSLLNIIWLAIGIRGLSATDHTRWAKKMFGFSLLTLLVFCVMISINAFLK